MPKVSVIIPTYNRANLIGEAVESVLAQTYKDYEIIIIDDGSTDNTKDALKKYGDKIGYLYKSNGGEASARNAGVKNARGIYIAFIDSDDLWLPKRLELGARALDSDKELGLVFSDCIKVVDGEKSAKTFFDNYKPYSGFVFKQLFMECFIPMPTVILRKECFDKLGIFDEGLPVAMDYDMWLRISTCFKIGCINTPLAIHRSHPQSISRLSLWFPKETLVKTAVKYKDLVAEFRCAAKRRISMILCDHGWYLMKKGSYYEAIGKAVGALKEDIFNPHGYKLLILCLLMKIRKKLGSIFK